MKWLKKFFLFLTGLFLVPTLVIAQTINLNEFLNQLKRTHPIFEKEKLTAQIEINEQKSFMGAQDWYIFSTVGYSHEEPAISFSGPEKTDALSVEGGIERLFWETGGRLTASFSSFYAGIKINPMFGFPESFYQNQLAVTYYHPLLKNRNGFLNRLEYKLKQYDIDFSKIRAQENIEDFLASAASKFLDWAFLSEQKKIITNRIKLSEDDLAATRKKRKANLVDQVDVIRSEDAVRFWKQNLGLIESRWKALQAELAELSEDQKINNASPEFDLYKIETPPPLEQSISDLKNNSRLIKILNIRINQLEYALSGYEETEKPDLSAFAQLNTKNLDKNLGKSLAMDKPDAVIGLKFSVPLENRTPKAKIEKTDLQIEQLHKQSDELSLTLISALKNFHMQLKELENVLQLNQEQIESAKERTMEELKLYNLGRSNLTFVILSQDNVENSKLTYAQNALTYHKLKLAYQALTDQLYKEQ